MRSPASVLPGRSSSAPRRTGWVLALLVGAALAGCGRGGDAEVPGEGLVIARVGEASLTEAQLREALGTATPGLDSAAARRQVVEQWVRRQLVVQEARRAGLDSDTEVVRQLRDSESAVLEAAYLERFFETNPAEPTEPEIEAYYEAAQSRLALREPYVRLRLIRVASADQAQAARGALAQIQGSPLADSLFALAAREYATDPDGAIDLADAFIPESRLLALDESLGARISAIGAGAAPVVVQGGDAAYAVAVVERVQAGQIPSLAMIRPEIAERLAIRGRKNAEARLIARLRSEAEARGRLEVQR
ncbi:MAG: peptidylprolyl isomerase [Bacteroidota bacterium]